MTRRDRPTVDQYACGSAGRRAPLAGPSPGYHGPPVTHRPERLRPPPHPLGVQPARRARADHGPRRHGGPPRLRFARRHGPRRALRVGRVLPGRDQGGHQADHRRRDLRRPAVDDRPRRAGGQPALPPHPAGNGPRRATGTCAGSSPTPTSTATTTSRASTASTSPATARGWSGLSACLGGEIPKALEAEDWDLARQVAGDYRDILGKDRFFLELQDHGIPEQHRLNEQLLRLAPEVGLPLVVTNDLHYVHREQHEAHDVLLCVGTGNNLDTPNRMKFETRDFFLKTAAEMAALFPDQPEAIRNTRRIAEMFDLALPLGELRIPHFPVPDGADRRDAGCARSARRASCGATARSRRELQKRLDYELGVIISMGYAGYFLIVADFVRFAREQGIATTCRGSAPGSIVTYTLGITPVDPIDYGLPFERFLNPDRVTMPDIDVDFEDERRDEVINYVSRKYGQDHVAQIITFGTMLARAAIRDVGRVMGMGYGEVDRIAKAVPNQLGIKLDEALVLSPQLKEMHDTDTQVEQLIGFAQPARGRRAQRVDARRGRRHQPRAADRAHAAPAGDQLRRADDPVRDARHRGAGPAQVRLPRPVQPHDPAQGGRPHPRQPRRRGRPRDHPARRREDVRPSRVGRDDRRVPARVRGHAALRPRAPADVGVRPRRHGRALPPGADGQHPGLHPPQARPGGGDLPPPAARAVPGEDVRDLRLPGGHHGRRHRARRVHGPGGGHARLRDPQEEVLRAARPEGEVRHPGRRSGASSPRSSTPCSRRSSRSSATGSTRPTPPATA